MENWRNDKQLQFVVTLKYESLKREQLSSITLEHVWQTLDGFIWAFKKPSSLNQAVNDVMSLRIGDIVGYLANQAIIDGSTMTLSDCSDIIGGN